MMKRILGAFLCLGLTALFADLPDSPAVKAAILPHATLIAWSNDAEAAKTAIKAKLDEFSATLDNNPAALALDMTQQGDVNDLIKNGNLLEKSLGIKKEDVSCWLASANLINIQAISKEQLLSTLDFLFVLELREPKLKTEPLKEVIEKLIAEKGMAATLAVKELAGVPTLYLTSEQVADFTLALPQDGKCLVMGREVLVKEALERIAAGTATPLSPAIQDCQKQLSDKNIGGLLFTLSPAMQASIKKFATPGEGEEPNPVRMALEPFSRAIGIVADISADDNLGVSLGILMDSPLDANIGKTGVIDNMALPAVKMLINKTATGKPLPLMDTIKSSMKDRFLSIDMLISPTDLSVLGNILKERQAFNELMNAE